MTAGNTHFPVHSADTGPVPAREMLGAAKAKFGFVPNLLGMMASSPALLEGYLALSGIFDKTSLTPTERQVVLLAVSFENGCDYCMAAHTVIAAMHQVPKDVVGALRDGRPIDDARLEALRAFTSDVVAQRGWPSPEIVARFTTAGYTEAQALDVVLGIGVKTLSNYANHLAGTPLDAAFASATWSRPAQCQASCGGPA